ncbi:HAD hydrolase-like protein, partial [Staphylococcus epidermidis]|nr:HAD hydrolase-like protein [Staphylococcus epidermidis]
MNFDSYIFDFDGTLIDTTTCHVKAIQSAFKRLNLDEPTEQAILHTYHLNLYN